MPASPQRIHIGFLDGIRGLSALYVVLSHIWQFAIAEQVSSPVWFKLASVLKYGHFGVGVFIVVSGYCLMLPVLREPNARLKGGLPEFARRRAKRLLPPFYVALAGSILLILATPALREESGTPWDITLPSFTAGKLLSHAVLFYNWSETWQWAFNPPMWSVALELQIYVVFALVLLPLWRWAGPWAMVAAAAILGTAPAVVGYGFVNTWMLLLFAGGMVAAAIGHSEGARFAALRRLPWGRATVVALAAVPLMTLAASKLVANPWQTMLQDLTAGAATMSLVTYLTLQLREGRPSRAARVLEVRPLALLGERSYSLYLVHYPVVAAIGVLFVHGSGLGAPAAFAALFSLALPGSLAMAALFFHLVERPFLNTKSQDTPKPVKPVAAPAPAPQAIDDGWIPWTPKMHERLLAGTAVLRGRDLELEWQVQLVEQRSQRVPGPHRQPAREPDYIRTHRPPPARPRPGSLSRREARSARYEA